LRLPFLYFCGRPGFHVRSGHPVLRRHPAVFPGILAVIYWPLGNRIGFISGLGRGMFIWFFAMLLPLVFHIDIIGLSPWGEYYQLNEKDSHFYTMASLSLNVAVFALVSLLTKTSPAEQAAAQSCSAESLARPTRHELVA